MEKDEMNLTHKHHAKKVVARDDIQVPVIKEKGRSTKEGYTLKRTHAITNYEIAYEKLFNEDDHDKYITELMEALSSGYEKTNIQNRSDVGTQTNLKLCEMDDDSIKNVIQDIIFDTSDEFEFKDVYSSEDEEFASVSSEQVQEMLNLEDSKKMLKKTVFGIRTDPVTGRIILVIYDEKGEAEVVPIGRGKVSDTKIIVNPKWADCPEILVIDSENELLHPVSHKKFSRDYDKKVLDTMNVRAVEVTKLFEYKYMDHLDDSYSDIEWQPDSLQIASQSPSSNIFSESELNMISQKMKNGFQEKRKKGKYDQSKEINLTEETDSDLQADQSVKFPIDSSKAENYPVNDKSSHPGKIKHDSSLGEPSSDADASLTKLDDKQTDAEIALKDKIHSKKDHRKSQDELDQSPSKMKEVSSKEHCEDEQQETTKQKLKMEDHLKLLDGEELHDRDQHLVKREEVTSKVHEENGHESDQDLVVTKETYRRDPNLFMKTVETKIPGEKTGFIKDPDFLIREEGDSKINGTKETHPTDSELSIKEEEPKIHGKKKGFKKDPHLFITEDIDSKIHEVEETHQTDPNLFIKEEEESNTYDQKRETHETEGNFFTEDSIIFVGKGISHRQEPDLDTLNHKEDLTKVDERFEVRKKASKAEEIIRAEGAAMPLDHTSQEPRRSQLKIESEEYKTVSTDENYKEDSGLSIIMPAASTQTSTPGKRSSILDTLQRVEEEMRPLKHQLAELQRQMWEIDASYPTATTASTESPTERPNESTTSFYSPHGSYVFPSRSLCKCPAGECHSTPQVICRKSIHERQTASLLTSLPTATELARRLIPPRSSHAPAATLRAEPEDVTSEQSIQSLKKTIGKKK